MAFCRLDFGSASSLSGLSAFSSQTLEHSRYFRNRLNGNLSTVFEMLCLCPPQALMLSVPGIESCASARRLSSPNATMLLTEGPLEEQAKYLVADALGIEQASDETSLLAPGGGALQTLFRRGIIGKRDRTSESMIPPGSIVHIDTQKRAISLGKDWKQA
jgi:hypothetical protein